MFLLLFRELKTAKTGKTDTGKTSEELQKHLDTIKELRLQVAKKNRSIAALQRQLDDIPSRAELAQYQRRFLELYNQGKCKIDSLKICTEFVNLCQLGFFPMQQVIYNTLILIFSCN